jgi:hypothetical protein
MKIKEVCNIELTSDDEGINILIRHSYGNYLYQFNHTKGKKMHEFFKSIYNE